jgi:TRAP transporter TAXI family solute receptor
MKSKTIVRLCVVLMTALCLNLISFTNAQAATRFMTFGGGGATGVYYFLAGGFSNIIGKYVPGVKMTPISTEASLENVNLIERGKVDFCLTDTYTILSLAKEGKAKNFRIIGDGYLSYSQWVVRAESPIKRIEDFRGKKVAVGAVGSGTLLQSRYVLETGYGITFKDFSPQTLAMGPQADAIRDGTIDVGHFSAGLPMAGVTDLATSIKIRFIPMEKEPIDRVMKQYPVVHGVIPGGTYPGHPENVPTISFANAWGCSASLPEDLVYQIVKTIYEHHDELVAVHPGAKGFTLDNIYQGMDLARKAGVQYHPGAIRYFKEKKVWKE